MYKACYNTAIKKGVEKDSMKQVESEKNGTVPNQKSVKFITKKKMLQSIKEPFEDFLHKACFNLMYNHQLLKKPTLFFLEQKLSYQHSTSEQLKYMLFETTWGYDYLWKHKEEIADQTNTKIEIIFEYLVQYPIKSAEFISFFKQSNNLHIRYLFMNYLINHQPQKFNQIFDDLIKYLKDNTQNQLMDMDEVCLLAIHILKSPLKDVYWNKIKTFIFANYPENTLASLLLDVPFGIKNREEELNKGKEEFQKDADRLFTTSIDFRFFLLIDYSEYISKNILESYRKILNSFQKDQRYDDALINIYIHRLGRKLEEYVEKYLSLSQSKDTYFIAEGTTSTCYRLGDYVIKLINYKWSYEKIICPNLYLIIKNLEEEYIRDSIGLVRAGLEIQPFLKRSAKEVPSEILSKFQMELNRLGYRHYDTLIKGKTGDNCLLLDSYQDADDPNPELLPEWFKEYPIVLVDRDLIFPLEKKHPKRQRKITY